MWEQTERDNKQSMFEENAENFGPLLNDIVDDSITDIDWNGKALWLTTVMNERIHVKDIDVDTAFFERFAQRIANINGITFNRINRVLEAETDTLRISCIHQASAATGLTCCIRKTPPIARIDAINAVSSKLCEERLLHLFVNCIKAHMNMVICGEPKAGKTEFGKFLSTFIPDNERVITIEDVLEWRYNDLKPDADCVQLRVDDKFSYSDAIKAALKQNPRWICLTETRGNEVRDLIKSFSTGVSGLTSLHTDDVKNVPDRMVNMVDADINTTHFLNNVYEFIDIAILVTIHIDQDGKRYRKISQVGFFGKDEATHKNYCRVIYSEGRFIFDTLPAIVMKKFRDAGIENPYFNDEIAAELQNADYVRRTEPVTENVPTVGTEEEHMPNIKEELKALAFGGGFTEEDEEL